MYSVTPPREPYDPESSGSSSTAAVPRSFRRNSSRYYNSVSLPLPPSAVATAYSGDNDASSSEEDDLEFRFEQPPLVEKQTTFFNEEENDEEERYSEEARKIALRRSVNELNSELKELQKKVSKQAQTKLFADINFQKWKINFLNENIKKELGSVNACTQEIDGMKRPDEYPQKMHKMRKEEVQRRSFIFEQIEAMCSILSQCPDENFKEQASLILANKSDELQKIQEEREELESEIRTLEEQFLAQNDFITNQLYIRDKTKAKEQLKKIYNNSASTIKSLSYDTNEIDSLNPIQRNIPSPIVSNNPFKPKSLLKPKVCIPPLDSRSTKSETIARESRKMRATPHRTLSCDIVKDFDSRFDYDDF